MKAQIYLAIAGLTFSSFVTAAVVTPPTVPISGVSTTGMVQTIDPPNQTDYPGAVLFGNFESNTTAFLWQEQTVTRNVDTGVSHLVSGGEMITSPGTLQTLGVGTYTSYFLHMESDMDSWNKQPLPLPSPSPVYTGSITFSTEIEALIYNKQENCDTHPIFGSPSTNYPTPPNCGSTQNFDFADVNNWISISADRKTLSFSQITPHDMDQVRILTAAVPVPAAVWLFGSGLLGLVGIARRSKTA